MPAPTPAVSIVVVADGPWDDTFRTLLAVARGGSPDVPHEVVVVDDGTDDETREALPRLDGVRFARNDRPSGAARASNQGARLARGRHLVFLHPDAEPASGWLAPLVRLADGDPAVAVVGSRVVGADGTVEGDAIALAYARPFPLTPVLVGEGAPAAPSSAVLDVPAVSGVALLTPAETFRRLGGFDETFGEAMEDVDYCLRARAGGGVVLAATESVVAHAARCGRPLADVAADVARLNRRWLGRVPLHDEGARRGTPAPAARTGRPAVAVLVPVGDDLGTLAPCLEAALRQLGPRDALVVADAGSTDGSRDFAELFARAHPHAVRVVSCAGGGVGAAARDALATVAQPLSVVLPAAVGAPDGFVDALADLLAANAELGVVGVDAAPAGFSAAGATPLLRAIAAHDEGAFFGPAAALDAAVAACGARFGVVRAG